MHRTRQALCLLAAILCTWMVLTTLGRTAHAAAPSAAGDLARQILDATGLKGGLIVHLGCGDGRLTAALAAGEGYLVQGLDTDLAHVEAARKHLRSLGLDGKVSVDRLVGERLPYIDNLVNLVVLEASANVPREELVRVLAPGGTAYVRQDGRWIKTVKPRPGQLDEWTHFLHGPDGNAVAHDDVVDFPYHVQWIDAPRHSRDHELATSMNVMVSAGGRIFYIMDEGPTAIAYYLPSRWRLVARDAFNGVILWSRPLAQWHPYLVHGRESVAADLWRRLVATEKELYTTETIFGPVAAVDPATGKTLRRYGGTEKTEEIIYQQGVLYLVASTSNIEALDRRQLSLSRETPDTKRIMAVQADTGKPLWVKEDEDTRGVHPLTLAAKHKRLLLQNTREVLCLATDSGKPLWRYPRPSNYARPGHATPTLVVHDDVVLSADRTGKPVTGRKGGAGSELIALSTADGKELWRCPCSENVGAGVDVFVAGGLVWVGENPNRAASDYNHGRDLHTGEIKKTFDHAANWPTWHHHRCYRDKATEKYLLAGRTGIEFVDLDSGNLTTHHWVRGICEFGILPCNGLIYTPPDQCACYIDSKLHGFHALAPRRSAKDDGHSPIEEPRLEKGPAYSLTSPISNPNPNPQSPIPNPSDWPTFRHDNSRSSFTRAELPLQLKPAWTTKIGGQLTSLVSAAGKVYVAQPQTHTVFCLDVESGQILWNYQVGARVDSPPSIGEGIAVFGCRDGWVYALRASDGALIWRFRAAPQERRLVEVGQLASVWPVHGSVLIEDGSVYFAAGRSSYLDGGMYLYKLELQTGKVQIEKHYSGRDPNTGQYVALFTRYDGEVLPDRELPGLLPDIFSCDGRNLYLRAVPLGRDLVIKDNEYVRHLFSSTGFLEDTWWERSYWIYGSHFYGGARGHGYAKTLFPAGRMLTFDEESVYGYLDLALETKRPGIFRVPQNPQFVDLAERVGTPTGRAAKARKNKAPSSADEIDPQSLRQTYVWKDGIPQNPKAMQLTKGKGGWQDVILRTMKYEHTWRSDVPLYPQAMLVNNTTFFLAGSPRFDEEAAAQRLAASPTDRFPFEPLLQDALDKFEGRKGGVLCAVDKADGKELMQVELPSSPVFDGLIAAAGRLYVSTIDGSVVCLGKVP